MLNFLENITYYLSILAVAAGVAVYIGSKFIPALPSILGVVLVIGGSYFIADHHGYERRVAEDQVEIIRLNTEARTKEADMKAKLEKADLVLRKAQDDIKTKQSNIDARADSGELRFPTSCGVSANSGSSARSTANGSDIERQAIKDIVALTTEGDTAITNLNACISQYNQVRETVNKGVQ